MNVTSKLISALWRTQIAFIVACGPPPEPQTPEVPYEPDLATTAARTPEPELVPVAEERVVETPVEKPAPVAPSDVGCADPAMHFAEGREVRWVCPDDAAASGLTIVDLGDQWTPRLFVPIGDKQPAFRDRYLQLASTDETSELFGVIPSLGVVRARLMDSGRHECKPTATEDSLAIQQALVCERLMRPEDVTSDLGPSAYAAIGAFQHRNFLMPYYQLDAETREALRSDSYERDFRLALRVLRERVADASGLIEDGTAAGGPQPILGRQLDPAVMRAARGTEGATLSGGAGDLIGAATETAARALGWTTAGGVRRFLSRYHAGARVALALPSPPAYHTTHMELSAELDRGDIWYDEVPTKRHIARRPTLVVYVNDNGEKRPLVRWATTIGAWSDHEKGDGEVVQKWKDSPVGKRVWRRLYAAPTWVPPKSTPDRDLMGDDGTVKHEILGPGPRGAFGLMLLVHERQKDGELKSTGIGTHGSASVVSIVDGTSHGCHRLYNQLAVRLGNFLLRHRNHAVRGDQPLRYSRVIEGQTLQSTTRGYLYVLEPPVPIEVLPGTIMSERQRPPSASAPASDDLLEN